MKSNTGEPKKFHSMHDPAVKEESNVDYEAISKRNQEASLESARRSEEALKRKQEIKPTTMKPLEDRIIIKPDVIAEVKTDSGIYLAPEAIQRMQPPRGTVIACGPGRQIEGNGVIFKIYLILCKFFKQTPELMTSMPIKPGDRVLYGHYAGTNIEDPETKENYLVMRLNDVFIQL